MFPICELLSCAFRGLLPPAMQRGCWKTFLGIVLGVLAFSSQAQTQSNWVEVAFDFLQNFPSASVSNSTASELRLPSSAGGIKMPALFQHPPAGRGASRVEWRLRLPAIASNEVFVLQTHTSLADGVKLSPDEDGVLFAVEIDGERVFSATRRQTQWTPLVIDLRAYAGRELTITFITDSIGNSSYDWAVWGQPRLLRFRNPGRFRQVGLGRGEFTTSVGLLAWNNAKSNCKVMIEPEGGSAVTIATTNEGWHIAELNLPASRKVTVKWEPIAALNGNDFIHANFPPEIKVTQISPAHALVFTNEMTPITLMLRNYGLGLLSQNEAVLRINAGPVEFTKAIPPMQPGATWRMDWNWKTPMAPGDAVLRAAVVGGTRSSEDVTKVISVLPHPKPQHSMQIENETMRVVFYQPAAAPPHAEVFRKESGRLISVATWAPLFRVVNVLNNAREHDWKPSSGLKIETSRSRGAAWPNSATISGRVLDADKVRWDLRLAVVLSTNDGVATLDYQWQPQQSRKVKALWGPNLYVGDRTTGSAKTWGLFPGLEYLYGGEPSSNIRDFAPNLADRRTPHPNKITLPIMAITIGDDSSSAPANAPTSFTPDSLLDSAAPKSPARATQTTVALDWDPLQKWDGIHSFPSARFASPNFDESMANHRMALFLPSTPEFVPENGSAANDPVVLRSGEALRLQCRMTMSSGPILGAVNHWLGANPLPPATPWPRSFEEELDLCREGFLKTVWDAKKKGWSHCIGWNAGHAPGFAALLWMDARIATNAASRERVDLAATNMLRDGGPGVFVSQSACHIMQWEFPFLYGYLPEALESAEKLVRHLIQTQRPGGEWLYEPANAEQASLGRAGDSVLGTCANRAATLLRYARITGDEQSLAAGEKALHFMERFRVPRGGQTWECPMYEPDILAAAYAIRSYHDAFRITGSMRWLNNAVYWAETGLPFNYLWTLPDKPMMLGASIPVFGSTFYTHTWLAIPVQWCGLVYAYHLLHLAQDLETVQLRPTDSPLKLSTSLKATDWKQLVELITSSALHQQFPDGDKIGAYPDSITRFEQRNPAFLNPEDILVNVLALRGYDPDVQTHRVQHNGAKVVISSGAKISKSSSAPASVRFVLTFFSGELSHTLVSGVRPREILANGQPLVQALNPVQRKVGWWWDDNRKRAYIVASHENSDVTIEVRE